MRKKAYSLLLATALTVSSLSLSACSNSSSDNGGETSTAPVETSTDAPTDAPEPSTEESTTEPETTKPIVLRDTVAPETDLVSDEMYVRADNFAASDATRIANVMKKAEAGEPITVAVIGGSITQGSSATNQENSYAQVMKRWWEATFPDCEINFVNAGIGGTTSYLGVHRVKEDLLDYNPDFVIVEFSVNDSDGMSYKKSYDNLVRRILKQENNPAVLLLFMTQENGTSAQNSHSAVGFGYGLPMLSYKDAILPEIENGNLLWADISPDNIHPNDKGHTMVGEIIWKYLNKVYESVDAYSDTVEPFTADAVTKDVYADATILTPNDIEADELGSFTVSTVRYQFFPDCWITEEGTGSLKFTVEATNIGFMYYKTTDGKSGQFEIFVDGESLGTLNADFKGGWGNYPETVPFYNGDEKATHTIEIKMSEGSTGTKFVLQGLMIS